MMWRSGRFMLPPMAKAKPCGRYSLGGERRLILMEQID